MLSLPTTHPAAQLQHTPLKSPGADDGAKSLVKQVYIEYSVVGTCEGAVSECAWEGKGERCVFCSVLICVAVVQILDADDIPFRSDVREYRNRSDTCESTQESRYTVFLFPLFTILSFLLSIHPFLRILVPRWKYHSTTPPRVLFVFSPVDCSTGRSTCPVYLSPFPLAFFDFVTRSFLSTFSPGCDADQAFCFLESSVVDGTTSLLVDAGAESGVRDGEGRGVVGDRGRCFWFMRFFSFSFRFSSHFLLSFSMLLIHLGFLWFISFDFLCVRRFGSFSIWWSICCVLHSFLRFCRRSSSSGWFERIRQSTVVRFRFPFLSFGVFFFHFVVFDCSIVVLELWLDAGSVLCIHFVLFFSSLLFLFLCLSFFSPLPLPLPFACIRYAMF